MKPEIPECLISIHLPAMTFRQQALQPTSNKLHHHHHSPRVSVRTGGVLMQHIMHGNVVPRYTSRHLAVRPVHSELRPTGCELPTELAQWSCHSLQPAAFAAY